MFQSSATRVICGFMLVGMVLTGCGQQTEKPASGSIVQSSAPTHVHGQVSPATSHAPPDGSPRTYSLEVTVNQTNGKYVLNVETDLKLSSEHYGGAPVAGEGHIHFYLNNSLVGPIKENGPFALNNLKEGTNTIKLVLAENNHVEDYGVSKVLTIEQEGKK